MFGELLRKGLGIDQPQDVNPMQPQEIGLQGALMAGMQPYQGMQMSPQQADMFGQYNNPMMFLRRM